LIVFDPENLRIWGFFSFRYRINSEIEASFSFDIKEIRIVYGHVVLPSYLQGRELRDIVMDILARISPSSLTTWIKQICLAVLSGQRGSDGRTGPE